MTQFLRHIMLLLLSCCRASINGPTAHTVRVGTTTHYTLNLNIKKNEE
jgi:hypothetical protein